MANGLQLQSERQRNFMEQMQRNTTDETKFWDGMCCRKDPDRAAIEAKRAQRRSNAISTAGVREANIERWRDDRLDAARRRRKPPPRFDEFTVFGLPSHGGKPQDFGVKDCLRSIEQEGDFPGPQDATEQRFHTNKLFAHINRIEAELRGEQRPASARGAPTTRPQLVPRGEGSYSAREGPPASPRAHSASSSRRPIASISAYAGAHADRTSQSLARWPFGRRRALSLYARSDLG